jgi:hypothetical protein
VSVECVYALTSRRRRGGAAIRVTGVRGERLRRRTVGGVDVIVGTLPRAPRPTHAMLRRYDRVMRALAARLPSLLPARFATCVAGIDELELAFRGREDRLRERLALVRGRTQMTLRLLGVPQGTPRGPRGLPRGSPRVARGVPASGMSGAQYLRRRAAETAIPAAFDLPRAAVKRWVKAERVERHDRGRLIASIYHLIPRGSADRYHRAIQEAALAAGVTMVITGPWPPYAFADL